MRRASIAAALVLAAALSATVPAAEPPTSLVEYQGQRFELPARNLNRYIALERQQDGSLRVVDHFVAAAEPDITRVKRGAGGALEYRGHDQEVITPSRR